VSQCGLAIYIEMDLKANEVLWKHSNISSCKNTIFKKNPLKETKNPSRYYNSITNLKSQHKPIYHHLSKILIQK
jgi:hypothetical protein